MSETKITIVGPSTVVTFNSTNSIGTVTTGEPLRYGYEELKSESPISNTKSMSSNGTVWKIGSVK